jgi:guanyl-specific ribonuclease Sa
LFYGSGVAVSRARRPAAWYHLQGYSPETGKTCPRIAGEVQMTRADNNKQIVVPSWIKFVVAVVVLIAALTGYWQGPHWREVLWNLIPASQPAPSAPDADGAPPAAAPTQASDDRPPATSQTPVESPPAEVPQPLPAATSARTTIPDQTIFNERGDEVFSGTVDVGPTLARIQAGEKLPFPNDGSTFQNREGRLPRKPAGYYREYVHPTPSLSGPGPQRIVMGEQGETYYTADHYRTFVKLTD